MIDAFATVANRPWLIQREALETILAVADRCGDPQALQTRLGRPLDNARSVSMRDGVAVIPISGPIFRYANLFTEISGATSTQVLATDIQAALDNRLVKAIVLDIDSPGGEASGISELARLIASARGTKPIVAYGGGTVASAAYWLASAAKEFVVDDTAIVGSIGVVMSHLDTSERDAKSGVRRVEIVSSQSPDKRVDPATEGGRAKVQSTVDALASVFVAAVAANRGVSEKAVLADFGRGGVLVGAAAVKARMADRLGSLEAVIAELAGRKPASTDAARVEHQGSQALVLAGTASQVPASVQSQVEKGVIAMRSQREVYEARRVQAYGLPVAVGQRNGARASSIRADGKMPTAAHGLPEKKFRSASEIFKARKVQAYSSAATGQNFDHVPPMARSAADVYESRRRDAGGLPIAPA